MTEYLITYLEPILLFISGGGMAAVFTLKYTRKTAQADAMKAVQDVYQETIADLRSDKDEMKKEIAELKEEVARNTGDIKALQTYKCIVMECPSRKRD